MINSISRFTIFSLVFLATAGCSTSGKVFLYDGEPGVSSLGKAINDIPLWQDAAAANRNTSLDLSDISSFKCHAKPKASAAVKSKSGDAVEVSVTAGCTGFVNRKYVHNAK